MGKTLSKVEREHINKSIECAHAALSEDFIYAIMCAGRKYYDYRDKEGYLLPGAIEEFEAVLDDIYEKWTLKRKERNGRFAAHN